MKQITVLIFIIHFVAVLILYLFTAKYIIPKIYEKAITYSYKLFFQNLNESNTITIKNTKEIQNAINNTILKEPEPESETLGSKLRKQAEKEKSENEYPIDPELGM